MAWFDGPGQARLERDKAIVPELAPGLRHDLQADGRMALVGDMVVRTASGVPSRIATQIGFPEDYPLGEPVARDIGDRFPHTPNRHFYDQDNICCLWLDVESKWRPRDRDALRTFLLELGVFYQRQLVMDAKPGRTYPGPQRLHGVHAYIEHLVDRWRMPPNELWRMVKAVDGGVSRSAPCPCGSRVRYRNCHRDRVRRFRNRIRSDRLEALSYALVASRPRRA